MALLIWVTVTAILGAFALYWYGRGNGDLQYNMEENAVVIILYIVFWPVTIPIVAVGFVLFKIGRFFYKLGERHKDKKDDV